MNEKRVEAGDRKIKLWLLIVSLATLVMLLAAALSENIFPEWRSLQKRYAKILQEKATDERGRKAADDFSLEITQLVLPELGAIDRCITCHTGTSDHRMEDQPQPFTTHPGKYLQVHDPAKFGCTVCHRGQGRATETKDAHGVDANWEYPLLKTKYIKSSCSQCHADQELYGPNSVLSRLDEADEESGKQSSALVERGRELVDEKGCLGCHVLQGKGGTLGLELTHVGDKTKHNFDFSHFERGEPLEVEYWHKKHFTDPGTVSPGTSMPATGLEEPELEALIAYLLSLRRSQVPASLITSTGTGSPLEDSGDRLYSRYCSACHSSDGNGGGVPSILTPSLNNVDALAVASDDYYRFIITHGRSETKMPGWGDGLGNLSRDEIDKIVNHIRQWEPHGADVVDVSAGRGDPLVGSSYYQGDCASCHGRKGEGGIGNSLNSASFLALASDQFLAETVVRGRPGTAMPSWKHLPARAVSDILAYLRTWRPEAPTFPAVRRAGRGLSRREKIRTGKAIYNGNCSACHGKKGEGGLGLRLNSADILGAVGDNFIYSAIVNGRPATAMPAWKQLSAEQVASVIAYLRSWQPYRPRWAGRSGQSSNDYALGELHYRTSCLRCHGEDGRGGVGPQLANPELLKTVDDATLFRWIGSGRSGTAMKGFLRREQGLTTLTPAQIAEVISYLRYLGTRDERPVMRTGVGNPTLGGQLYKGNCSSCHGVEGEGGSGPQLNNPTFLESASDGFIAATMVTGRSGTPMRSMVHGQEGLAQISPERIQDIIAYMRLWDFPQTWLRSREVAEMSERAIISGSEQYTRYCSGCHGPKGRSSLEGSAYHAPSLNNPEFLDAVSDGFLLATIARGRSGTAMRPFGHGAGGIVSLKSEDISDIVSFLRTWSRGGQAPKGANR